MNDYEKRLRKSRKRAEIIEAIAVIIVLLVAVGSVVASVFVYKRLFAADIPEWMKWALLFFG